MKSVFTLAGIILVAASVSAAPTQALIANNDDWSFWVKPEVKLTQFGGQWATMPGFQLGPALGHTLYFGLAGYALVNNVNAGEQYENLKAFDFWDTGVSMDWTLFHTSLVHGSVECFLGYGQLNVNPLQGSSDRADLFVADPGINVMLNLTSSLELGIGGSYRIVNGSNFQDLSNSDLSGLAGSVFLRWTEE
ncbi:MAG: hypothetical protein KKG09_07030 [Verrucomicrobia bacterium]|nr:hypothetical protein [Verrucomicrobiota bacterium]MCG2679236.1 hypothetical protein [Kiritimatiellia bacterium]MBU4248630.1 hypothetical protein [Verrucomicrobiota bacterium]MBU4290091.1 hypothetical protein [Verrucomicrobiota bacterium]MBU4429789.1 hypothetical protein [Verrucomicrobiota bacterium]